MYQNHLGDNDTTPLADYGLVDTDYAHIIEPPHTTRYG
jgi:hypothetical protein